MTNKCKQCGKETSSPKFCNKSCAATYNNRGVRRHGKARRKCTVCGEPTKRSTSTVCSLKCDSVRRRQEYIERWKRGEVSGTKGTKVVSISGHVRTFLLEEANYKCTECGWGEINKSTGNPPLEIDHIDGDWTNNIPENLRVLCPNCHSLKPTHTGLNRGSGTRTGLKEYNSSNYRTLTHS